MIPSIVVVAQPAMGTRTLPNGESPVRWPGTSGSDGGLPVPPEPYAIPEVLAGEGSGAGSSTAAGELVAGVVAAEPDGLAVGRAVARGVGAGAGFAVGGAVGFGVGFAVGGAVGFGVGLGVGGGGGALTLTVDGLTLVRVTDLAPEPVPLVAVNRYPQVPAGSRRVVEKVTPAA
jgi:hypothetical protein